MSKHSARPAGPITRKQQMAALRAQKGHEIAQNVAMQVAEQLKALVDKAVDDKFKGVLDTMTDLIDRVVSLENSGVQVLPYKPSTDEDCYCVRERVESVQRYYCSQCGYIGLEMQHDGCSHCAAPLVTSCNPPS